MFVGGSPSSTAGGIRTTTLIVIFACIIAKIRGLQQTRLFHRGISHVNVLEAFSVTIVAAILLALASVVVFYDTPTTMSSLPRLTMLGSFFETASAFGTVGLSVGVTTNVGHAGQIALILMMFIGQLGVTATLLS
jgi:Trk-type K+ transport system membrane component